MPDSSDTAREKQAAKRVPKRKKPVLGPPVPKFKPSADARSFGAHTAIFVPPELQNETGPKKPTGPTSVVFKTPKPRPETVPQKRKRQAQETQARERLRLGLKISTPTGRNNLDAVPDYVPPPKGLLGTRKLLGMDVWDPAPAAHLAAQIGKGIEQGAQHKVVNWGKDVAAFPGETIRALLDQSPGAGPRMAPLPVPKSAYKTAEVVGKAEPLVRPLGKTASYLSTEKGQQAIWGNSLVNLAVHGDTPGSAMDVAGLGLGILGILPLGKVTNLARIAKAAKDAGRIGEALPDSEARTAWKAVMAQRVGEEQANNLILLTDQAARNLHPDNPLHFYEQTTAHATNYADFAKTAGAKTARYQTAAGIRQGLVEGMPTSTTEAPVFYSDLQREVTKLPVGGYGKQQTIDTLSKGVTKAEWENSGMKDFFASYGSKEKVPPAAIQQHLSSSLNAYNLDEFIRSSNSTEFPTIWDKRLGHGGVIVKTPTPEEPYYEIVMRLQKPMYERITKGIMGGAKRVDAPYVGKGMDHWRDTDVVAHARFHVVTDAEGKSALLIEEIQSDWASNWRNLERGGGGKAAEQRLTDLQAKLAGLERQYTDMAVDPRGEFNVDVYDLERELEQTTQEIEDAKKVVNDTPGPPPLGEKQADAAIKRLLRYAHDANVDRVIIPRGDVQSLRNVAFDALPSGEPFAIKPEDIGWSFDKIDQWKQEVGGLGHDELAAYAASHQAKEGPAKTLADLYEKRYPRIFEKNMGEKGTLKQGIYQGRFSDQYGGIIDRGEHPMDGYVIEMTEGAKAKAAAPMRLYQTAPNPADIPKGATEFLADGRQAIHLFEDADVSTIIHELAHVAYSDLNEVDQAILGRHFNFATEAGHEAYARALERYVYDGMAMTSELDGVFAKLRTWMGKVYLTVNNIGAHVHPEVKLVFDRMLVQNETPAQQLVRMLKAAPPVRKAQEIGYTAERAKRIGDAMDAMETGGLEGFISAKAALKGALPKEAFTALDELAPEAVDALLNTIYHHPYTRGYEKVRAMDAIVKASNGEVPTHSELLLLEKIFGKSVGFKKVEHSGVMKVMLELVNLPRSIAASFDLSAPFRQGLVAGARHPLIFKRNLIPMVKAMREVNSADLAEEIALRPSFPLMQRAKLAVETHATNPWAQREEQFYSSYADKLWGVKHSARAYEGFLHKMRADVFDHMLAAAMKKNIDVNDQQFLEGLGVYVNQITGRGAMPENQILNLESAAPALNTLLFSPRLLASRVNMISPFYYRKLWQADPFLAKQAVRSAVQTLGVTASILFIASEMPGVTVGIDPTSANFGKIRVGDTRVDILGGFQPLLVFIFREALGKSTSSSTGKTQNLRGGYGSSSRWDIAMRFGESKMAPTPGIVRDLAMNQTFIGQPVTTKNELANFIPMVWRDAWDTAQESNDPTTKVMGATAAVILGGLGLGFTSYPNKVAKTKGGGGGGAGPSWSDTSSGSGPSWGDTSSGEGPVWTP